MLTDGETALAALTEAIGNPGAGAPVIELSALASSQWDPYRGARDDWAAI
jgi:hypothetical protein